MVMVFSIAQHTKGKFSSHYSVQSYGQVLLPGLCFQNHILTIAHLKYTEPRHTRQTSVSCRPQCNVCFLRKYSLRLSSMSTKVFFDRMFILTMSFRITHELTMKSVFFLERGIFYRMTTEKECLMVNVNVQEWAHNGHSVQSCLLYTSRCV